MKTITKIFAVASFLTMFAVTVEAQVTASASTEATIIAPISISKQVDLNFGNLAVGATGGVVTLAPVLAATRSQVGGVTFPVVVGTVTAAEFDVNGLADQTYSIILPTSFLITNTTGTGGETMVVDNFTSTPTPTGTLDGSGYEVLYVGADVTVAANQQYGVYQSTADFDVTVNYN
ncbi:MAG: DUF4402 domain-containing protein [Bacteroidetes bacterium]|nr:DUF4402 domain-containing protein [Bacteroidota bacterium]